MVGFYLRKSVKAGPFRVNLSKSGIGVSAGVPGFRVGTGPRGSYVSMGRHGIYYRSTLSARRTTASSLQRLPLPPRQAIQASAVPMEDVTGATVLELSPASPSALVEQLNEAAAARRVWIGALAATLILTATAVSAGALALIVLEVGLVASWWLRQRDLARSTVVVFHDVADEDATLFDHLCDTFEQVAACNGVWQKTAEGAVGSTYQWKVNAGANRIVQRQTLSRNMRGPAHLSSNITVPTLSASRRSTYLLPDRMLIREGRRYNDIPYSSLRTSVAPSRFIENGSVPRDATQVGTTWQYVNKSGGPDRRFKNNRQLPVMQYAELTLLGPGRYANTWQLSRPAAAQTLHMALESMGQAAQRRWRQVPT
jgi:hypothetical protein